jgi:hypothetical protein
MRVIHKKPVNFFILISVLLSFKAVLQPDHTWIVAPVPEPYLRRPGVTVANIEAVLQDMGERR